MVPRDVTKTDWETFIDFLLPDHRRLGNERKVRDVPSLVSAQFSGLRIDGEKTSAGGASDFESTWENAKKTVEEWNEGFFRARGVEMILRRGGRAGKQSEEAMSEEEQRQRQRHLQSLRGAAAGGMEAPLGEQRQQMPPPGGLFGRFGTWSGLQDTDDRQGSRGLRQGRISIWDGRSTFDNDLNGHREQGIRTGDFTAERHGRGGRLGGHHFRGPIPALLPCGRGGRLGGPGPVWSPFGGRGARNGGGPFGRGGGPLAGLARLASRGPISPPGLSGWHAHESPGRGRGHRREEANNKRARSRSSSTSSSSSSASSASIESVGSLPDYDQLSDNQLPLARDFLEKSLNDPDELLTKEKVQQVKQALKNAQQNDSSEMSRAYHAALKKEVKSMMAEWKALKRSRKREARQRIRQRRQEKRALKQEQRAMKRELRKERREQRRENRREATRFPRGRWTSHGYTSPDVPPVSNAGASFPSREQFDRDAEEFFSDFAPISPVPGSWPVDVHASSKAKYEFVERLKREIALKEKELALLHRDIEELAASKDKIGHNNEFKRAEQVQADLYQLQRRLRDELVEADAKFARELAESDV